MADEKQMGNIEAIRTFFNTEGYPPVTLIELKGMSKEERDELGTLCRVELKS